MQKTSVTEGSGPYLPPEGTKIAFYLGNIMVTTNFDRSIQLALYSNHVMDYLREKYEWNDQHANGIN